MRGEVPKPGSPKLRLASRLAAGLLSQEPVVITWETSTGSRSSCSLTKVNCSVSNAASQLVMRQRGEVHIDGECST